MAPDELYGGGTQKTSIQLQRTKYTDVQQLMKNSNTTPNQLCASLEGGLARVASGLQDRSTPLASGLMVQRSPER